MACRVLGVAPLFLGVAAIQASAASVPLVQVDFNTPDGTQTTANLADVSFQPTVVDSSFSFSLDDAPVHTAGGSSGGFSGNAQTFIGWDDHDQTDRLTLVTMTAWINPASIGEGNQIWNKNFGGGGGGYSFDLVNAGDAQTPDYRLRARIRVDGGPSNNIQLLSSTNIDLDEWQFVALTLDLTPSSTAAADALRLYLGDGSSLAEVGSLTGHLGNRTTRNGEGLSIGSRQRSNPASFEGLIDNARFYNNAVLSEAELISVMQYDDMAAPQVVPSPVAVLAAMPMLAGLMLRRRRAR